MAGINLDFGRNILLGLIFSHSAPTHGLNDGIVKSMHKYQIYGKWTQAIQFPWIGRKTDENISFYSNTTNASKIYFK